MVLRDLLQVANSRTLFTLCDAGTGICFADKVSMMRFFLPYASEPYPDYLDLFVVSFSCCGNDELCVLVDL